MCPSFLCLAMLAAGRPQRDSETAWTVGIADVETRRLTLIQLLHLAKCSSRVGHPGTRGHAEQHYQRVNCLVVGVKRKLIRHVRISRADYPRHYRTSPRYSGQ